MRDSEVLEYLMYLVDNDNKKLFLIMEFVRRMVLEREGREAALALIEKVRHDRS